MRDYGEPGQLGLEQDFKTYIIKLCNIFDRVKRVLKETGTCWVNLGDTYSSNSKGDNRTREEKQSKSKLNKNMDPNKDKSQYDIHGTRKIVTGLPDKCLCQIPSRFAIEMTNRGWILRNEIIWYKPSCMPASVKDRFTTDFEKLFFFTKNKKYYFEQQLEKTLTKDNSNRNRDITKLNNTPGRTRMSGLKVNNYDYKNKRCVWKIPTKPFTEAHFACYPEELCETPIKAGCPKNGVVLDPFSGSGTTGKVALKLGRKYIGIDLKKEYLDMSLKTRLRDKYLNL